MEVRGTIYKLTVIVREKIAGLDSETVHTYIGSTTHTLHRRLQEHRATAIGGKANSILYQKMRESSENNISKIEGGVFKNSAELRLREEYWRKILMPDLNVRRCALTDEQKEAECRERNAKYYQANRERILPGARERSLRRYYENKQIIAAAKAIATA